MQQEREQIGKHMPVGHTHFWRPHPGYRRWTVSSKAAPKNKFRMSASGQQSATRCLLLGYESHFWARQGHQRFWFWEGWTKEVSVTHELIEKNCSHLQGIVSVHQKRIFNPNNGNERVSLPPRATLWYRYPVLLQQPSTSTFHRDFSGQRPYSLW